jgi:hypothetical protein
MGEHFERRLERWAAHRIQHNVRAAAVSQLPN